MNEYQSNYSVYLPSYSIGADCYKEIPQVTRFFGRTAVVIGGETAMGKAKPFLLEGVAGSGVKLIGFIPYGGDSTYENGGRLIADPTVQAADMLFAVGGGRACDTVKYVADKLDKPLFTFPTVASNCAPVTAISVIYNADGTFREYYYPKLANHCFINSAVIADSPEPLLWAGIGDALSKECEAVFASQDDALSHTPLMGRQVSRVLLQFLAGALRLLRRDGDEARPQPPARGDRIARRAVPVALCGGGGGDSAHHAVQRLGRPAGLLRRHRGRRGGIRADGG